MRVTIRGIVFEIGPDEVLGGPRTMNLEARRLDTARALKLQTLPDSWQRDEYDRHAWFDSLPGTPARKLADALLFQGMAVLEPGIGWLFRYEKNVPWSQIAPGCEFHDGRGWNKKTADIDPSQPRLACYFIRY